MDEDLVTRLQKRAEIRRQIGTRKSVQEGKPDRIADLLEEAAAEILRLTPPKKQTAQEWANNLTKEQAADFVVSITGNWTDLEPELWQEIIYTIEFNKLVPITYGLGTHCSNYTYQIGKNLYDLTYEHGCEKPCDIKFKRIPE